MSEVERIQTRHLSGETVEVEVTLREGPLALHPMPPEDGAKPRRAWTITHVPSGTHVITGVRKKTAAVQFMKDALAAAEQYKLDLSQDNIALANDPAFIDWALWCKNARATVDVLKACEL